MSNFGASLSSSRQRIPSESLFATNRHSTALAPKSNAPFGHRLSALSSESTKPEAPTLNARPKVAVIKSPDAGHSSATKGDKAKGPSDQIEASLGHLQSQAAAATSNNRKTDGENGHVATKTTSEGVVTSTAPATSGVGIISDGAASATTLQGEKFSKINQDEAWAITQLKALAISERFAQSELELLRHLCRALEIDDVYLEAFTQRFALLDCYRTKGVSTRQLLFLTNAAETPFVYRVFRHDRDSSAETTPTGKLPGDHIMSFGMSKLSALSLFLACFEVCSASPKKVKVNPSKYTCAITRSKGIEQGEQGGSYEHERIIIEEKKDNLVLQTAKLGHFIVRNGKVDNIYKCAFLRQYVEYILHQYEEHGIDAYRKAYPKRSMRPGTAASKESQSVLETEVLDQVRGFFWFCSGVITPHREFLSEGVKDLIISLRANQPVNENSSKNLYLTPNVIGMAPVLVQEPFTLRRGLTKRFLGNRFWQATRGQREQIQSRAGFSYPITFDDIVQPVERKTTEVNRRKSSLLNVLGLGPKASQLIVKPEDQEKQGPCNFALGDIGALDSTGDARHWMRTFADNILLCYSMDNRPKSSESQRSINQAAVSAQTTSTVSIPIARAIMVRKFGFQFASQILEASSQIQDSAVPNSSIRNEEERLKLAQQCIEPPDEEHWTAMKDEALNREFYYNIRTGESRWDQPKALKQHLKTKAEAFEASKLHEGDKVLAWDDYRAQKLKKQKRIGYVAFVNEADQVAAVVFEDGYRREDTPIFEVERLEIANAETFAQLRRPRASLFVPATVIEHK